MAVSMDDDDNLGDSANDLRTSALIHVKEFGSELVIDDSNDNPVDDYDHDDVRVSQKRGSLVMPRLNTQTTLVKPGHDCTGQGCKICLSLGDAVDDRRCTRAPKKGKTLINVSIFKKKNKKKRNISSLEEPQDDSVPTAMLKHLETCKGCELCVSGITADVCTGTGGKRKKAYSKEGSLVSKFLRMMETNFMPNLSSFKLFSSKDIEREKHLFSTQGPSDMTMSVDNRDGVIDDTALDALMKQPSADIIAPVTISSNPPASTTSNAKKQRSFPFVFGGRKNIFSFKTNDPDCIIDPPVDNVAPINEKKRSFPFLFGSRNVLSSNVDHDIDQLLKQPSADMSGPSPHPVQTANTNAVSKSTNGPKQRSFPSLFGSSKNISFATDNDILLGKGTKTNKHPGNIKYRELVDGLKPAYKALGSSKKKKKQFTQDVLDEIKNYGGRFLKLVDVKNGESYREIPDKIAREKISQKFRDS